MRIGRRKFLAGAAVFALAGATSATAQSAWPSRPVRLVVPYPPGGGTDYFARLVGAAMADALGQSVIVENRAGAATIIGAEAVARAAPDGYTILLGDTATFAANKSLYQKLPYDPQKDFAPITLTGRFAIVLLVNTNKLKVASLKDLIEAARRAPGAIDYASPGVGSPFHLATELLAGAAGIKLSHVPYRGIAPALQDLAAGQMGVMFVDFASARSQLATPGIKALAVASPTELAGLPGVPTVAAGGFPGFEAWAWQGLRRARGNAGRHRWQAQCGLPRRHQEPGDRGQAQRRGDRRAAEHAGGVFRLHAGRDREMGKSGQGRQYPGRLAPALRLDSGVWVRRFRDSVRKDPHSPSGGNCFLPGQGSKIVPHCGRTLVDRILLCMGLFFTKMNCPSTILWAGAPGARRAYVTQ